MNTDMNSCIRKYCQVVKSYMKSGVPRFQMLAAGSDGWPLQLTQAGVKASDGGKPRVFLDRKLCKVQVNSPATTAV